MSSFRDKISATGSRVGSALKSTRGRSVLLYFLFVAVAFVFWLLLSLDNEVQRDFEVPVEIVGTPDSVTVVSTAPRFINVNVKGKGTQLLRFGLGGIPSFKIKFDECAIAGSDNTFGLPKGRLESRLREYFGQGVNIVSCRPDSIILAYTTRPGVKIKLHVNADVEAGLQYIISGPVTANVDSVNVYTTGTIPRDLHVIETEMLNLTNLRDTVRVQVKVKPVKGLRIIPDRVTVTVPVEPLISRNRKAQIEVINVPEGAELITFPSKVDVTYLVPMSLYNTDIPLKVYVDYDKVSMSSSKLPVSLSLIPETYKNVTVSPDSVEYIIENKP